MSNKHTCADCSHFVGGCPYCVSACDEECPARTRERELSDRLEIAVKWIKWLEGEMAAVRKEAADVLGEIK